MKKQQSFTGSQEDLAQVLDVLGGPKTITTLLIFLLRRWSLQAPSKLHLWNGLHIRAAFKISRFSELWRQRGSIRNEFHSSGPHCNGRAGPVVGCLLGYKLSIFLRHRSLNSAHRLAVGYGIVKLAAHLVNVDLFFWLWLLHPRYIQSLWNFALRFKRLWTFTLRNR